MDCCQSAVLPLALGVRVEPAFSEVDVYVEGTILLHVLQAQTKRIKNQQPA